MKQYIVDRHTVPGTPSLNEVPNEKIKTYGSEALLDADLTNIPENEIVATEDGAESSTKIGNPLGTILAIHSNAVPYGYLPCNGVAFDEHQYPALYALLGDNHTPYSYDKSRLGEWESVTISTSSASPTVMPFDGFITGKVASQIGTMAYIYINGTAFAMIATADAVHYRFTLPVKKGDEVYFDTVSSQVSYTDVFAAYYTHFNVIKATSGLEETQQDYVLQSLLEADSYSTDEVATGKKWIDGKTIYKKTYYSATNWANNTVIDTISNMETLVDKSTLTVTAADNWYGEWNGGSDYNLTEVSTSGNIIARRAGSFAYPKPSHVTIFYTKTN